MENQASPLSEAQKVSTRVHFSQRHRSRELEWVLGPSFPEDLLGFSILVALIRTLVQESRGALPITGEETEGWKLAYLAQGLAVREASVTSALTLVTSDVSAVRQRVSNPVCEITARSPRVTQLRSRPQHL